MSKVLRVEVSKVRIPRSQSITWVLPRATMYSASISRSFQVDHRVVQLHLARDELEWLGDRDRVRHTRELAERFRIQRAAVPGDAYCGAGGSRDGMRGEAERSDVALHGFLLLTGHVGLEDD